MSNTTKGIYLSLITALVSGVSIFINKFAVDAVSPALYFVSLKNISVALLIVSLVLFTGEWKKILLLSKKQLAYLLSIGLVGGSLPFYLYFTGLSQSSAINAALIHKTLVFWVAILAISFLKEKLSKIQLLAISLLFLGNIFVGGFKGFAFSWGELMLLLATLLWAVENILAKKVLATVSPNIVVAFRMGIGSLILMSATLLTVPQVFTKSLTLNPTQAFWVFLTVISLLAYNLFWYRALKHASAVTVTAVLVSSTLVTNVLSAIFITHSWNLTLTIQATLLSLGVFLITKASLKTQNTLATIR